MNHYLKILFICPILLLILSGCVPIPHQAQLTPSITGAIQNGNIPLSHASVYLDATINNEECHEYILVTKTNQNGEFSIGPVKEFRWIAYIYGDPVAYWTLCVDTTSGREVLLKQGGIGMPRTELDIKCDISNDDISYIEAFGVIKGKCIEK